MLSDQLPLPSHPTLTPSWKGESSLLLFSKTSLLAGPGCPQLATPCAFSSSTLFSKESGNLETPVSILLL